MPLRPKL